MRDNRADSLAGTLRDILRRLRIVETAPQLTKASIKDGALRILDAVFDVRVKLGRLDVDYDGDGELDYGLVIFNAAGDWALLGTKQGVFVRGAVQGGTIDIGGSDATSFHVDALGRLWVGAALFADGPFRVDANGDLTVEGGTIIGSTIETEAAPAGRIKITDNPGIAGIDHAIQFFEGSEPAGAQGAVAQFLGVDGRAIIQMTPSGMHGAGLAERASVMAVSKAADGTGQREVLLYGGDRIYGDAAVTHLTGDLTVGDDVTVGDDLSVTDDATIGGDVTIGGLLRKGTRGVPGIRAGLALVGGAVDPYNANVYEQAGYWTVTTNAAGDGVILFPEAFPNGLLDVQVTLMGANHVTQWVTFGLHDNPTTGQIAIRFFDGATGAALGAGIGFALFYRALGW